MQGGNPVYVWVPMQPRDARLLQRAVGMLLGDINGKQSALEESQDVPELQARSESYYVALPQ